MLSPLSKCLINNKNKGEGLNNQERKMKQRGCKQQIIWVRTANMSENCKFTPRFLSEAAQAAVSCQFDLTLTVFHVCQKFCFKKSGPVYCCPS